MRGKGRSEAGEGGRDGKRKGCCVHAGGYACMHV